MKIREQVGFLALTAVLLFAGTGCGPNEADVASITGKGVTPVQTGSVPTQTPTAPPPGLPAAISFAGAQPVTIGVRGSGLPEQSTLTFRVTDALAIPVPDVIVDFTLSQIADESIEPTQGITDANGNVQVVLTSGQRSLSVQITAQVSSVTPPLTVRSTAVNILGGPPSLLHFSLAEQFLNISGRVLLGVTDEITAFVGDRFGNPVPAGTAVSFTTSGGAIGNPMTTNSLGQAIATLVSEAPLPSDGIVAILATTHGERPFIDSNANGVCDAQDELLPVAEPFYDTNCNGVPDEGEDFIDLNGDRKLNDDQGSGTRACDDQVVLSENICNTFSGPTNVLLTASGTGPIPAGGSRDFTLTISDADGNPIVGGSTVSITLNGSRARLLGPMDFTIGDSQTLGQIVDGLNRFHFTVVDNAPTSTTSETDAVTVTVKSAGLPPGGNGSVIVTNVITFEAGTAQTPTPTPASQAPAIVPINATLSAGDGAPPNSCNGGTQTFVVTGGNPPFSVFGGGGCVNVASVPVSGGSFTFTAGNVLGSYSVTATDAIGRTASAGVIVQGPPTPTPSITPLPSITPTATPGAAFIQIALFINQASDNGDGTLSSVVSALVTNANGATVGNGVPVQFRLQAPAAGVSVTSPGLTGAEAPCTLSFPVIAQPGDAFSCVKYDRALQGRTVTIEATVQTASGSLMSTQTIVLPDVRTPTPTATATQTPTSTPTVTPTATPAAAHIQVALFVNQASSNGDGTLSSVVSALVTDASGAAVGNGVPVQFSLVAPVPAGVSVTSPGITGEPALCTLGFPVLAQPGDALSCVKYDTARQGQSVTIQAVVQTPSGPLTSTQSIVLPDLRPTPTFTFTPTATPTPTPTATPAAAHIQLALFINTASNNNDGTLSTVVSALVTDATGATVGNGVPVQFSLVAPVLAGVSVTSPGFTGQDAPCTLGLGVVPQPGDALSCVKYDSARQGQSVTIQAVVQTPSGPLTSTQAIILPDLRTPTATPTRTPTPTPAAAHIQVALFVNAACTNQDGTFTTVISAVVSDAGGAAVPDGIPVAFSLVGTVPAGLAFTTPGFTGGAPPCTLMCLTVPQQPGDALCCIKYDAALAGQTITMQASVAVPAGPPPTDTEAIKLP